MISQKFAVKPSKNRKDMESIKDVLFKILPDLNFKPQPTKGFQGNKLPFDYWLYTFVNCQSCIQFEFELKNGMYGATLDCSSLPPEIYNNIMDCIPLSIKNRLYTV